MALAQANRARRTGWVCIDSDGTRSFLFADKRAIIQDLALNIPIRDMRLLDFNIFTSGKILVRDNAIIFTIEHVRMIITANKVIIPREGIDTNLRNASYIDVLEEAIHEWHSCQKRLLRGDSDSGNGEHWDDLNRPHEGEADDAGSGSMWRHDYDILPFEMVVLEAALKEAVHATTVQVKELESVAMPALDSLTKRITPATLERVRKVKTRHQRLLIKCETLRDEMERFLGDDDDMMKMCLTRKQDLEQASPRHPSSGLAGGPGDGQRLGTGTLAPASSLSHGWSVRMRSPFARVGSPRVGGEGFGTLTPVVPALDLGRGSMAPAPTGAPSEREDLIADMEIVENLLESYYMQIDGLYDRVVSLDEYIKDTEEYINIELDASRNRLIRLDIILTAGAFCLAPFNLLAGILGENLIIPPQITGTVNKFYMVNMVAGTICLCFFVTLMRYMKHRRLI